MTERLRDNTGHRRATGLRRPPALSVAAFLLVALLAALSGLHCGGGDDARSEDPGGNDAGSAASPTPTVPGALPGNAATSSLHAARINLPLDLADGYFLGSPTAPVTLTIYEDFQCPHCLRYVAEDEPPIVEEYVKSGKVRLQFQNYSILGVESVMAALAGQCAADQGRFWEYHNALFTLQAEAGQLSAEKLNVGRFSQEALEGVAADLGLDSAAFSECLASTAARDAVQAQVARAQEIGLRGTPSFLLNGVPLPGIPQDLAAWRSLLDN